MVKKTKAVPPAHRGRFQAQGLKLEASVAWAVTIPPSTEEGKEMLDELESNLERRDAKIRKAAFCKARDYIQKAYEAGGVNAEKTKTFPVRNTCSERVDLEIRYGSAFKVVRNV